MKLIINIILCFCISVYCYSQAVTFKDESSLISRLSRFGFKTPEQVNLNRTASAADYNKVYGFELDPAKFSMGFKWNSEDQETKQWRPQGITGFTRNNRKFLLITWYGYEYETGQNKDEHMRNVHNEHRGSRISLVDVTFMSNNTYRHILLVQQDSNRTNRSLFWASVNNYKQLGLFIPVTTHAGGVSYYDGKIFVAETNVGFRVFDLNKIVEADANESQDSLGLTANGQLKAFNYRYILPQIGVYRISTGAPFSSAEIGDGYVSGEKLLFSAQFLRDEEDKVENPKVIGLKLGSNASLLPISPETIRVKDWNGGKAYGMQGVYRTGVKTYMSITGRSVTAAKSGARLCVYTDRDAVGKEYAWPHGAEDLYVEKRFDLRTNLTTSYLWCLTEYETEKYGKDNRCIFAVKLSEY